MVGWDEGVEEIAWREPSQESEMGVAGPSMQGPPAEKAGRGLVIKSVAVLIVIVIVAAVLWQVVNTGQERSDWAYDMVQLTSANAEGYTGKGITVAVVDTGIDVDHPSLKGVDIVAWKDFVNGRADPYDDQGHGTAMSSIIAGQDPLPGGAVDVKLIVAKVLNKNGESSDSVVALGIRYSIDPNGDGDYRDGADIISLSLGGKTSYFLQIIGQESTAAINEATDHGILVVAAAGNDGENDDGEVASPGWLSGVICVGAVDSNGLIAPFSSAGRNLLKQDPNKKPEAVAPGVDIISANFGGGYRISSGTSQATAFMSTVLAVVLSAHPGLAHDGAQGGNAAVITSIKWALYESSKKVGGQNTPHDNHYGYGLVQTQGLIEALA